MKALDRYRAHIILKKLKNGTYLVQKNRYGTAGHIIMQDHVDQLKLDLPNARFLFI